MGRPFISFDKPDGLGVRAQVRVQVFDAPISRVMPGDGGKSVKVVFDHEALGLKHPVYGWCHVGSATAEAAEAACGTGEVVAARIETSRKPGRDRKLPLPGKTAEPGGLASDSDLRSLCAAVNGAASDEALTDPAEDPKWEDIARANVPAFLQADDVPAAAGVAAPSDPAHVLAALHTAAEAGMDLPVLTQLQALALAAGAKPSEVTVPVRHRSAAPSPAGRVRSKEAPPWEGLNSDGTPNLGAWEIGHVLHCSKLAREQIRRARPKASPAEVFERAAKLTPTLVALVDGVQRRAYGNGRADRMARSWQVACAEVVDLLDTSHPVPFGSQAAARDEWAHEVTVEAAQRIRDAAEYIHGEGRLPALADDVPADTGPTPDTAKEPVSPAVTAEPDGSVAVAAASDPREALLARVSTLLDAAGLSGAPDSPFTQVVRKLLHVGVISQASDEHIRMLLDTHEADPARFATWVHGHAATAA